MSSEERRASLNAGYTEDGFADEVFHIHLRFAGDNDELYFRDFLNDTRGTTWCPTARPGPWAPSGGSG